jgi:membrane associated rhomboid family serine protease
MGIYDRDYSRREGSGLFGSLGDRGTACLWLIGITVGVFVAQMLTTPAGARGWMRELFDLDADRVLHGEVWRLLSYAFLHDPNSFLPILWNMLFLYWFGRDMEDVYGPREFLAFYLGSALLGGLAFVLTILATGAPRGVLFYYGSAVPVTAVLVLCALHYPTKIIYLFLILPVPIWLVALFTVVINAFGFLSNLSGQKPELGLLAAVPAAFLAACAFAFVYYKRQWRVTTWWPDVRGLRRRLTRPPLRVYREEEPATPVTVAAASPDDEQLEAKMDAILEKISRTGKESLTPGERDLLLRASEVFKRRRR